MRTGGAAAGPGRKEPRSVSRSPQPPRGRVDPDARTHDIAEKKPRLHRAAPQRTARTGRYSLCDRNAAYRVV